MEISGKLLRWYLRNHRDLPWRHTRDPYLIWVSEIVLQQTRVEQGTGYYLRFVSRFPDIASLASARPDDVMKCWEGLGYYSRARNMQTAAQEVSDRFGGTFPSTYHDILSLKGIGPYTAAAIASICFNEPTPVVDGNVIRFLSRLSGMDQPAGSAQGKKAIHALATRLMDPARPGEFNQAMMEFGALYCKPSKPDCPKCIFRKECVAYRDGRVEELPSRMKKTAATVRYFHYLVVRMKKNSEIRMFIQKREKEDIWKGLFQLPLIETEEDLSPEQLHQSKEWKTLFKGSGVKLIHSGRTIVHKLSHRVIHARFYLVDVKKPLKSDFIMVPEEQVKEFPFPKLIERFLASF